ncbi:hypothetical protein TNCV_3842651 [Trichonephila clavipes]|nr:hypothetical protein TNCV_3842651 [Trichonephila clavipes]
MSDLDVGALETFYLKLLAQIKVEAARLGNILQTDEVYFQLKWPNEYSQLLHLCEQQQQQQNKSACWSSSVIALCKF